MEPGDRVVVVTGAARGIGKAIADELGKCGARVVLADISEAQLAETAGAFREKGYQVLSRCTDTTDVESVQTLWEIVRETYGPIDILINNAGTFSSIAPIWEADPQKWYRDIRVNLYGSFLMCRRFVGDLVENRRGYVINIVSSGGISDPHAYMTSYASSKTGLLRMTEGLAAEVEPYDVKAFAVAPPAILTDMTKFIMHDTGGKKWRPEFKQLFDDGVDQPPEAVSRLIIELVGGSADELSGRCFLVTEDLSTVVGRAQEILDNELMTLRVRRLP